MRRGFYTHFSDGLDEHDDTQWLLMTQGEEGQSAKASVVSDYIPFV